MNKPHFFVEGIPYYSFFLYDAIHPLIGDETLKRKKIYVPIYLPRACTIHTYIR